MDIKYTKENVELLRKRYCEETISVEDIATEFNFPVRSVISKLSSLGVYKRKEYLNKLGDIPIKKAEYIDLIAESLGVQLEQLESLEKCNKNVLKIIYFATKNEK